MVQVTLMTIVIYDHHIFIVQATYVYRFYRPQWTNLSWQGQTLGSTS